MTTVYIDQHDAVFCKIKCSESGVLAEIKDHFSYEIENAKYHPLVRIKKWDGIISLLNMSTRTLYNGLIPHLEQFCSDRQYEVQTSFKNSNSVDLDEVRAYVESLNVSNGDGEPMKARDYQVASVFDMIKHKRILLQSPTSSGKSLLLYVLIRWLLDNDQNVLLVVPNVSLINQMFSDFKDYSKLNGWDVDSFMHKVQAGTDKSNKEKQFTLSTWQSIAKLDQEYFAKFDAVIMDEAHTCTANSLKSIMEKCTNAWYRIGVTGTIDVRGQKLKTNKLVLQGLFGFIKQVVTTKELMDAGSVANLKIKVLNLKYDLDHRKLYTEYVKKTFKKKDKQKEYAFEITSLTENKNRNLFIAKLAISQTKNTLILTRYVENHAIPLHKLITSMANKDRPIYLITGDIKGEERERIRKICESDKDAIIVASSQTMSTGVSIKNLHNYISASPSKSVVQVLQSIGRLLRTTKDKSEAIMYDIADDISLNGKHNYAKLHMLERLEIYDNEQFSYKVLDIPFKAN